MAKKNLSRQILPPFFNSGFDVVEIGELLDQIARNPHPTDVLLDTSVFALDRIPFIKSLLALCRPILLLPVCVELQDLKIKPQLADLRELVFSGDSFNERFRGDDRNVLSSFSRYSLKYASLLSWRRTLIDVEARRIERETGSRPGGRALSKLIQELVRGGISQDTIRLSSKEYRVDRPTDEILAVFASISPIVTGRDCFLLTADKDVFEQTIRMIDLLFNDYGAYLIANDFRLNGSKYTHRHRHLSPLFNGEAEAIGRDAHPDYLLPPPQLLKTCATHVVDVGRRRGFTWIGAINMYAAISFQEYDPLGRKGDPGNNRSILFTASEIKGTPFPCRLKYHFVIGDPQLLKLTGNFVGPVPYFDLVRATTRMAKDESPRKKILTPFSDHRQRLLDQLYRGSSSPKARR